MLILTAEGLSKAYTEKVLLQSVSLSVSRGDKIGVVGLNGAGKSTLLRILAGEETPDAGTVTTAGGVRTAYLSQSPCPKNGVGGNQHEFERMILWDFLRLTSPLKPSA